MVRPSYAALLQAEIQRQQGYCILENSKKTTQLWAYGAHPQNIFQSLSIQIMIFTNPDFEEQLSF